MKLEKKVAFVTGAAKGIGRAIVLALAKEGASVVVADIDLESARQTAQEANCLGREARAVRVDVAQPAEVERAVAEALSAFGRIDILVNNAGIIRRGNFLDHSREDWDLVLQVNLGGMFNCAKKIVPHMIKQGGGKIISISSVAGKVGDITSAPSYGTSKGAMNTFTRSLARELAPYGINVNAIAPHAIETEMSAEWPAEQRRQIVEAIPLKRLGRPEEVAEAVVFFASDGANFITGEIMDINGGYFMD